MTNNYKQIEKSFNPQLKETLDLLYLYHQYNSVYITRARTWNCFSLKTTCFHLKKLHRNIPLQLQWGVVYFYTGNIHRLHNNYPKKKKQHTSINKTIIHNKNTLRDTRQHKSIATFPSKQTSQSRKHCTSCRINH